MASSVSCARRAVAVRPEVVAGEAGQELAILLAAVLGEAADAGIAGTELLEAAGRAHG